MNMLEMMTPEALTGTMVIGAGFFYLIAKLLEFIGSWKMFTKSGESGWKAFIPVYNKYIRFNLYWDKKFFWIYMALTIASFFLGTDATGVMGLIATVVSLGLIIVLIKMDMKTARSFGKGIGMGILLFLMPWLATIILGFGKAEYQSIEK